MLNKIGVASKDLVLSRFFDEKTLVKPKAILECYEEIPCNPCSTSCPFDAIHIGENINKKPELDVDKCVGCGICITSCPGLAITVVSIKGEKAIFKIPYEMSPKPIKGDIVSGINRHGEVICDVEIVRVDGHQRHDRTVILDVAVPLIYLHDFITVRV